MTDKFIFRYLIIASSLMMGITSALAQQYPVFTQYYFNELVINPAYAGNHVQVSMTSTYRNQWVNFPGAPRTFSFSGHTALNNGKVGVGLLVNHDEIGSYKNDNVYAYYAYRIAFKKAILSMGLSGGFNILGVDYNLDLLNQGDLSFISVNTAKPNFGAGLFLNFKNSFVGLSVPFLINSTLVTKVSDIGAQITEARYYFLRAGTYQPLNVKKTVKLNPSFLVRAQEGQPLAVDLNLGVVIHDVLSTGASWRIGDALIGFVDLKLSERFHFAYSYDLTGSDLNKFSNGSHEFMLNYRTRIRSVHKNVECPGYYGYGETKNVRFNPRKKR